MDHPTISFSTVEEYNLPEFFVYTKLNLADNLIFGTGVRKNVVIDRTPSYWSYQGNLNYNIKEKHSFNLSAGHYNRLAMPNAQDYEITHYKSNQYSLDYTLTTDLFELQTSVFKKNVFHGDYEDDIIGGEFYTKISIKPVEFQFSITSLDVEIKTDIDTYPSDYDLDYFVRSSLKYNVRDIFEISTIYIFRQGSYYRPVTKSYLDTETQTYHPVYEDWDNAERLPDYHKIDVSISKYWVLNSKLALVLYANVSNLLNNDNVMAVNYNWDYSVSFNELYSQRSVYFGVSIIF